MKLSRLGPPIMSALPDWLVKPAVKRIIKAEENTGAGDNASMAELALSLPYDIAIAQSIDGSITKFQGHQAAGLAHRRKQEPTVSQAGARRIGADHPRHDQGRDRGGRPRRRVERRPAPIPARQPDCFDEVLKTCFATVTGGGMASKVISSRGDVPSAGSR
jgi:hypothetical protein